MSFVLLRLPIQLHNPSYSGYCTANSYPIITPAGMFLLLFDQDLPQSFCPICGRLSVYCLPLLPMLGEKRPALLTPEETEKLCEGSLIRVNESEKLTSLLN